ncbi:MAG: hypothetical protein JSW28_08130, partial [Thermoplasmata archaeon]
STFVRQEEMKELGSERGANRLQIFQKLFRLETFEKAEVLASKRMARIKRDAGNLETEMRVRGEQVSKLPSLSEELKQRKACITEEKAKLEGLTKKIEKRNEELKELFEKHDEYSSLNGRKRGIEERRNRTKQKLAKATAEQKKAEPLRKDIKELEKATENYETLRSQGEELRELGHQYQMLKRELARDKKQSETLVKERDAEIRKLTTRIAGYENRIAKLSTSVGKEEAFLMLRREGSLSERVERIGKEIAWLKEKRELVEALKKERSQAEKELKELKEKTVNINEDSFVLSEITTNIEQLKDDMVDINANFEKKSEDVGRKIQETQAQLEELDFGEEKRKRLTEIRDMIAEMQKRREELDRKRKNLEAIGDASSLIKDLESQAKGMGDELKSLEERLFALGKDEEEYQKSKRKSEEMRKAKEVMVGRISRVEGEISRLEGQMTELKELKIKMKETAEELNEKREQGEIYSILKDKVFHKRGIVMYAIDQLLPQLSLETSANLSDMTDGRFSKVKLSGYEENNRYGISIAVAGADGEWHDVQEFSGGEKTQINAALRFAVARELASMPQVGRTYGKMKTLFIDEGDLGSLDTEISRQLFVAKLFSMGEFFEKIILITHLTEVAEQFPGRIMVYMTPEQESKIQVMA